MIKNIEPEAINPISGSVNYNLDLTHMAKKNRHNPTKTEDLLWQKVLRYKMTGYKFIRQKPINRFILDFYCSELNMAIEIDGGSHIKKKATDELRDLFLKQIGVKTIRFTNEEIINHILVVKNTIKLVCSDLALSRGGARRAEGLVS